MSKQTNPNAVTGIKYALIAGMFGSLSSVSGKLAMDGEQPFIAHLLYLITGLTTRLAIVQYVEIVYLSYSHSQVIIILRIGCFLLNLLCTATMWGYFVASMSEISSLTATVVNTGSNFLFTALLGWSIFGERLSMRWWLGASLLITGLCLIVQGENQANQKED